MGGQAQVAERRAPPRLKIRHRLLVARGITAIMCNRLAFLLLGSAPADKTWSRIRRVALASSNTPLCDAHHSGEAGAFLD
jgi:hypothetical protein